MIAGAAAIAVVSLFTDGTPLPMVAVIALCAAGALALCALTLAPRLAPRNAETPLA